MTPRTLRLTVAILALFTVWITWRAKALETGLSNNHSAHFPPLNKAAPAFSLPTLDGRPVTLADYRGRNVVVTFWASWCGPCRMEMPVLRTFYERTRKQDNDFVILAISIDSDPGDAATAATELRIPFPVLHDASGKVSNQYGVDAIPTLFVIDRKGDLTYAHTGLDMGIEIMLAQQLGIKNYSPIAAGSQAGAPQ
jgi:peroxiredoxin